MRMTKCLKCDSEDIHEGEIISKIFAYKPKAHSIFRSAVKITPFACLHCGYMEFYTDLEHIKK